MEQEVWATLHRHLASIYSGDVKTYEDTTGEDLSLFEWWVVPHRQDGLDFHRFMIEHRWAGEGDTRYDLLEPRLQLYDDTAIVSYTFMLSRARPEGGVEHRQVERERGGQLGGRHQARDERLAGGVVEGGGRGEEGVGTVQEGEALVPREGQGGEGHGSGQHRGLRGEHHPPAVVAVGRDPAPQGEEDDRQHPREAEGAQGQGRAREQVDVPVQGHRLHLRARQRDELRQPEEPEVAVPQDPVRRGQNRNTPKRVSGISALRAAEIPSARTARVSAGAMMPSSQRRAVE